MATTVGQHSVAAFTSPVNGTTPIDANTVRGNDNTVRVAYVDHDADPGIHVQSSTLASRPVAGTAGRKWITEDSGVYTLWFDDGTNWHPVSSENVALSVLAGETLAKGDVVKVTGWNNGQDLPEVAKVASASDTAFAVMTAAVASGAMGYATNTGIVQDVNTGSFSVGNILYPNTSGGFTATKPTSGNYQPVAFVLRSNSNNGVIFVEFSAPRIVERSDNTASTIVLRDASGNFSAGTITAGALTSTGLVTFASLKGTGATTVTDILNDSTMATASATTLATSSSIKTYVDNKVATVDTLAEVLANGNTTGANDIIVNAGQKIRTPLIASQNNATAITIADTTGALTFASALADSNLATISTAGKVANSATTATSANTASAIVARDASGNFTAGTITATLSGTATQVSQALTAGSYLTSGGTYNGATARTFAVDATDANTASKVVARDASGNFSAGTITATLNGAAPAGSLSGTTLASNVVSSSLTSVGTLTSLTVSGASNLNGKLTVTSSSEVAKFGSTSAVNTYVAFARDNTTLGYIGNAGGIMTGGGATDFGITSTGSRPLVFGTADLPRMTLDASGNLLMGQAASFIGTNTADGADSSTLTISGGGGGNSQRGAYVFMAGNENASAGNIEISSGNVAGSSLTLTGRSTTSYISFLSGGITERMRLDASGNLGLGVTPSAWLSAYKVFQNQGGSFASSATSNVQVTQNAYLNASTQWIYTNSTYASQYSQTLGQHQWYTAASGTAGNAITFTQAMTLDASGQLSVGTTAVTTAGSAYQAFTINGANGSNLALNGGGTNIGLIYAATGNSNLYIGNQTAGGAVIFNAGSGTERARITSGGTFCVAKTSDDDTIVGMNFRDTGYGTFTRSSSSNSDSTVHVYSTGAGAYRFYVGMGGTVYATNTTISAISDARLKENIRDLDVGLDAILALKPRKYDWKQGKGQDTKDVRGFIAQEFEEVFPDLVDEWKDEAPEGEEPYRSVRQDLIPVLVKAMQEQQAMIVALEARLEALEA